MKGFTILILSLFAVIIFSTQAFAACPDISAQSTQELIEEVPSIDEELQGCPIKLEKGLSLLVSNPTQIDIVMTNGTVKNYTVTVTDGEVTGVSEGAATCKKKVTTSESVLDEILGSEDRNTAALDAFAEKEFDVEGCTFFSKASLFVMKPIGRFFAGFGSS